MSAIEIRWDVSNQGWYIFGAGVPAPTGVSRKPKTWLVRDRVYFRDDWRATVPATRHPTQPLCG